MYTKQWLIDLPISTIFVMQDGEQYTLYEKQYKKKDRVQRYLKRPFLKEPVRIYYSDEEQQCKLAYPEPNWDFPLEGRIKGVIYPQECVLEAA